MCERCIEIVLLSDDAIVDFRGKGRTLAECSNTVRSRPCEVVMVRDVLHLQLLCEKT